MIKQDTKNIFFYWEGHPAPSRMKMLEDCVYSTRIFNPDRPIYVVSNSIKSFDAKFDIQIVKWDEKIFEGVYVPCLNKYMEASPREMSDLMRILLLYKFGGSYIDTDDLCINKMSELKNLVCRSYDPHTCHYNNIKPEECIEGKHREIRGYDHINIFPRNDCWQNFEPRSKFIHDILNNEKFLNSQKVIYIGDGFSWQSLTLESCLKNINHIGEVYNLGLTLLYLYEDFVACCSYWDRCHSGGEMCDIYSQLPNIKNYEWGKYKCDQKTSEEFYKKIIGTYPHVSHMWLHSKDMKKEWTEKIDKSIENNLSTWIYNFILEKI